MQLFYSPDIKNSLQLDEQESLHAVKVLRLKKGDKIFLTDGIGGFFEMEIVNPHPKRCELKILSEKPFSIKDQKHYIHIAMAPAKNNERNEWFLEKAIEFGVDEISFLICNHSERKVINMERMEKLAVVAMKQSLKAKLPKLNPVLPFKEFMSKAGSVTKFIAHLEEGEKKSLFNAAIPNTSCLVAIGPEGDFSPEEINLAFKNDFQPVSLGKSRLRTETAALAACHILNLINESND